MQATDTSHDAATRRWTLNPGDEAAVRNGCRFDEERATQAVEWIETYCRLYEGEWAGEPLKLTDWQLDFVQRLFGWVRWSEKWGRWVRRFRQASIWVAKKNKKTPTAAALALYLLCGDGEQGQKVFLAAKDGKQVRENLAKHVIEMLRRSPDLLEECAENRTTMQVTHEPTSSVVLVLSGSEGEDSKSKEGLNGSVIVDETHVVDRQFMDRVSRAGISRSEPLLIEISTAGDDPDGYGAERFAYAQEVLSGAREDQELLAIVYAAPQDLADDELAKDPLKYGRMANPAMGHTVDPEEFLSDYQRSKDSLYKLATFKKYRLNIWQKAANPWLNGADWGKCRRDFTAEELHGRECSAGLDLSRTRDMSALVLVFNMGDGTFRILPYFWLPEDVAKENDHLAPFLTWARQGYLTLTPGNVMDFGFVRAQVRELAKQFRIRKLLYDPTYAEETTQALEQGVMDDRGKMVEESAGIPREMFPQTLMAYTAPCKDFERLLIAGQLHHNGNKVMDWQAGHVTVKEDVNGNIRPVKPKRGSVKKIDGVVSAVMGLADAQKADEQRPRVEWF